MKCVIIFLNDDVNHEIKGQENEENAKKCLDSKKNFKNFPEISIFRFSIS